MGNSSLAFPGGKQKHSTMIANAYSIVKQHVSAYFSGKNHFSSASRSVFITGAAFLAAQKRLGISVSMSLSLVYSLFRSSRPDDSDIIRARF